MSYMERVSWMSESGYSDIKLLEYIYISTLTRLNVNLLGKSIRNPSTIVIFALTATW